MGLNKASAEPAQYSGELSKQAPTCLGEGLSHLGFLRLQHLLLQVGLAQHFLQQQQLCFQARLLDFCLIELLVPVNGGISSLLKEAIIRPLLEKNILGSNSVGQL